MTAHKIYWKSGLSVINPSELVRNSGIIISSSLEENPIRPSLNLEIRRDMDGAMTEFMISYWSMLEDELFSTWEEVESYRRKENVDIWAEVRSFYDDLCVKDYLSLIGKRVCGIYYMPRDSLVGIEKFRG